MARQRNAVLAALELVRRRYPDLNLVGLRTLLYIAENPGVNVVELAELCGTTTATASRTTRALLPEGVAEALSPKLGLVADRAARLVVRDRSFVLTESGHALLEEIDAIIRQAGEVDSR